MLDYTNFSRSSYDVFSFLGFFWHRKDFLCNIFFVSFLKSLFLWYWTVTKFHKYLFSYLYVVKLGSLQKDERTSLHRSEKPVSRTKTPKWHVRTSVPSPCQYTLCVLQLWSRSLLKKEKILGSNLAEERRVWDLQIWHSAWVSIRRSKEFTTFMQCLTLKCCSLSNKSQAHISKIVF